MSVDITYFVHGTTLDNEKNISSGWKDVELSSLGIQQSKDLVKQIEPVKFDVVFSSDLKRSVDSANITFKGVSPIVPDQRLRECNYGDFNGKESSVVEPMQEKNISSPFPNGESYEDVKNRILDFLETIKQEYQGKRVAIVAHKAPQLALEVILNNKTWDQAFAEDWRKTKSWRPGWKYILK